MAHTATTDLITTHAFTPWRPHPHRCNTCGKVAHRHAQAPGTDPHEGCTRTDEHEHSVLECTGPLTAAQAGTAVVTEIDAIVATAVPPVTKEQAVAHAIVADSVSAGAATPPAKPKRHARRGPPGNPCSSCHKLCSLEDPEVDGDPTVEVDDEGSVHIDVSIVRNSSCCGVENKRADNLECDVQIEHECANADLVGREVKGETVEAGYEDAEAELEGYTGTRAVDRHGKPIKNYRFMTTTVGVSGSGHATCKACGEQVDFDVPEGLLETEAGSMEAVQ